MTSKCVLWLPWVCSLPSVSCQEFTLNLFHILLSEHLRGVHQRGPSAAVVLLVQLLNKMCSVLYECESLCRTKQSCCRVVVFFPKHSKMQHCDTQHAAVWGVNVNNATQVSLAASQPPLHPHWFSMEGRPVQRRAR